MAAFCEENGHFDIWLTLVHSLLQNVSKTIKETLFSRRSQLKLRALGITVNNKNSYITLKHCLRPVLNVMVLTTYINDEGYVRYNL